MRRIPASLTHTDSHTRVFPRPGYRINMDIQNNGSDDEFFGSQEDFQTDSTLPISCVQRNEFGDMGEHEIYAKHNELKNVGFLDAYDEFKESRLQEGFEFGFLESFEAGKIIGKMIGEVATLEKMDDRQSHNESTIPHNNLGIRVTEIVNEFFTTEFQNGSADSSNGKQDLENLIAKTENYLAADHAVNLT